MEIQTLTRFFMWCTILNAGFLTLSFLLWITLSSFIYKMHGKLFPMSRETFNAIFYSFLGIYKLLVYFFNIVPWLVLLIIR